MQKRTVILTLLLLTFSASAFAQQDKSQRPSPPAQAQCKFSDGKTISVDYSSPRIKGRKVYGGLVPYGQVWRTGANEATTFVTTANLTVGGKSIPAGNYTLFTVPNPDKWTLIINKKTGEWGIPYKYEADELLRADMRVSKLPSSVENFTISFDQMGSACTLNVIWDNNKSSAEFVESK